MKTYPFTTPQILTEQIFVNYRGDTGTMSAFELQAAFIAAEEQVSEFLDTFLVPTVITGSYQTHGNLRILTDYAYINSVDAVTLYQKKNDTSCTYLTENGCAYVVADEHGLLDISGVVNCACGSFVSPSRVDLVLNVGLASGTVYNPFFLLALKTQAQIHVNEIRRWGNESTGDIGVTEFDNQEYQEKRMSLVSTALGNSAISNYVRNLLSRYQVRRYVGL